MQLSHPGKMKANAAEPWQWKQDLDVRIQEESGRCSYFLIPVPQPPLLWAPCLGTAMHGQPMCCRTWPDAALVKPVSLLVRFEPGLGAHTAKPEKLPGSS